MGMKKKVLSATLCAVMVSSLAAPAFTVQAADDTLVYWSMWEATEPQGQVIQEAVDAYTESHSKETTTILGAVFPMAIRL